MSKKTIGIIVAIAMVIIIYLGYGYFNPQSEGGIVDNQIAEAYAAEVADIPATKQEIEEKFSKDGYIDKAKWEKAFNKKQTKALKNIKSSIKKYKKYYTSNQLTKMKKYKSKIKDAKSIAAIDKCTKSYKKIEKKAKKKYKAAKVIEKRMKIKGPTNFKSRGVINYAGKKYTYYSSRVLRHYRTSEWTLDSRGYYRDKDGYFVVATKNVKMGGLVKMPWGGYGKRYDTCPTYGVVDVYVGW